MTQPGSQHPALAALSRFVGIWNVDLAFPADPSNIIHGQASFDWIEGDSFVVEHLADSTWIMGLDDTSGTYSVLYHDGRGVCRVYQMSLEDNVWKVWRNTPDFSQRFTGAFSEDGNTITASWEKSFDGSTWEHDFDVTYTKVR